jgi:hypothetical protein
MILKKTRILDDYTVIRKLPFFKSSKYLKIFRANLEYVHKKKSFLFIAKNAYIANYGLVFKRGFFLPTISSQMRMNRFRMFRLYLSCIKKILLKKVMWLDKECVVVHNNYASNYYHWLTEIILRLFLIKEELAGKTVILPSLTQKFQSQVLSLFSDSNFEVAKIDPINLIKVKKVYNPSFIADYGNYHPESIKKFSLWVKKKVAVSIAKVGLNQSKIYISRKRAEFRRLLNEDELISYLLRYDFHIVELEDLNFADQVALFNNASLIVGPHGAGFTNLMFCKKETTVIEIFEENYIHLCYYNLADVFDLNYNYVIAKTIVHDEHNWKSDMFLDMTTIIKLLDDLTPLEG